jgi:taurine dioxygenase
MNSLDVSPLNDNLTFGARVSGLTEALTKDAAVCARLNEVFEDRGVIVFEDVEPTLKMQMAISNVFGPPKEFPVKAALVDTGDGTASSVLQIKREPGASDNYIVEIDGKPYCNWRPFHFDHAYTNELNRGGVLRAVVLAPAGGMTGFADGIQLYNDFSPDLRTRIERLNVIYTMDALLCHMRFGMPPNVREIKSESPEVIQQIVEVTKSMPRAIHPAVWTRKSGEKVLHVSGQHSVGIEGHEDPEGDALLEAVCQEIIAKARPYFHSWKPTDMVLWDNWRMLHAVSGINPEHSRTVHRTTIKGDYGLGYYEHEAGLRGPRESSK